MYLMKEKGAGNGRGHASKIQIASPTAQSLTGFTDLLTELNFKDYLKQCEAVDFLKVCLDLVGKCSPSLDRFMTGNLSRMDKCEGKWVYFKAYIPDVMNKSFSDSRGSDPN